jgi:hypothetical protein
MTNKKSNQFFIGAKELQNIPNADVIKHPRVIYEFKGLRTKEQMTSSKSKKIFSLNVLNDKKGNGQLFATSTFVDRRQELGIDYFKRGNSANECEELLTRIVSILNETNAIVCTFSETSCVSTSIVKIMLEIDGGKKYNAEKQKEQFIKLEKGIDIEPIFEVETNRFIVRLMTKMAGTYKFQIQKKGSKRKQNVSIFNIGSLFENNLEKGYNKIKAEKDFTFKRVIEEEIDFDQFNEEYINSLDIFDYKQQGSEYVSDVFSKLGYESFATYLMMDKISMMFARKNGVFLNSVYSAGNILEQTLACVLTMEERVSIHSKTLNDDLVSTNGAENTLNALHLATQSYSGGKIELYQHGNVSQGMTADLASAYPSIMAKALYKIDKHTKIITPEITEHSKIDDFKPKFGEYVFVQAQVFASGEEKHSLLSKKAVDNEYAKTPKEEKEDDKNLVKKKADRVNVNPRGDFEATDLWEAIKFFENGRGNKIYEIQKVIIIKTRGEKHLFSDLSVQWFDDRMMDKKNEFIIKTILNSMYGKLFEGYPQYELVEGEITFTGFEAGSYFNPILASVITSFARVLLTTGERVIENNGGTMIGCVVDSLNFTKKYNTKKSMGLTEHQKELKRTLEKRIEQFGTEGMLYGDTFPSWFYEQEEEIDMEDMLPQEYPCILEENYGICGGWSKEKRLGYFSKPEKFTNGFFVDVGSYEYKLNGKFVFKTMGYKLPKELKDDEFSKEHGIFKWGFLKSMMLDKKLNIANSSADGTYGFQIEYPVLASIGFLLSRNEIDLSILGQQSTMLWTISPRGSFFDSDKKRNPNTEMALYTDDFEYNLRFNFVYCDDYEEVYPHIASSTLFDFEPLLVITKEDKEKTDLSSFFKQVPDRRDRERVMSKLLKLPIRSTKKEVETVRSLGVQNCLARVIELELTSHLFLEG